MKEASAIQASLVTKGVSDLAMQERSPENTEALRQFVQEMFTVTFITADFGLHVRSLSNILNGAVTEDIEALADQHRACDHFVKAKDSPFYKAMALFRPGSR